MTYPRPHSSKLGSEPPLNSSVLSLCLSFFFCKMEQVLLLGLLGGVSKKGPSM